MPDESSQPCPRCGAAASGSYCSACGAALTSGRCGRCNATLAPGAKFCHVCGATRGAAQPPASTVNRTPWIVTAALAVVAIGALVYAAGRSSPAPAAEPVAGTPPDLSKMTPREQFTRLNDRVTAAAEQGDSLTVVRFWPMAAEAYTHLPPGDRDVDTHFHMAWLQLLAGQYPEAAALADTIMQESPGNLFGYYVRASIAEARGDSAAARASRVAFREHFDAEMKRTDRSEYADHRSMLQRLRSDST